MDDYFNDDRDNFNNLLKDVDDYFSPGNKTHTNCFDLYCVIQSPRAKRTALLRRAVLYALGLCISQYRYQTS